MPHKWQGVALGYQTTSLQNLRFHAVQCYAYVPRMNTSRKDPDKLCTNVSLPCIGTTSRTVGGLPCFVEYCLEILEIYKGSVKE